MKTLNEMFLFKYDLLVKYLISNQMSLFGTNVEKTHELHWYRLLLTLQ